jgi:hypothetical protein
MNVNKLSGNDNELEQRKNNLSGNDKKLLFEMESELAEELFPRLQGSHSIAFPRQGS